MPEPNQWLVYGFLAVGLSALLFTFFRELRRARRAADDLQARLERERDTFHSLDSLMQDISAIVFEAAQRAEAKVIALDRALKRADQRVDRFAVLLHAADQLAPLLVVQGSRRAAQRRVFSLADDGIARQAIASEVGIGIGEVELMLALRDKRRAHG